MASHEETTPARDNGGLRRRPMEFLSSFTYLCNWPSDTGLDPPVVTSFLYLDGIPDASDVETVCSEILLFDNFRSVPQRCRRPWYVPYTTKCEWREVKVGPADIITRVQVKGSAMVLREMERIKGSKLPRFAEDGRDLPLWNMHVIENTDLSEGTSGLGSVIALRFYHTIADGMSMMVVARVAFKSTSPNADGPLEMEHNGVGASLAKDSRSDEGRFSGRGIGKTVSSFFEALGLTFAASDTPLPFGHLEGPLARGRHGEPWNPSPSEGPHKRKAFSGRRRIVLFPDIPLSLVKKLKAAGNAKVNDVILCLFSGCVRRYCEAMGAGDSIGGDGFKSRAVIPVALPRTMAPEDKATALCNRWGIATLSLHLDEPDSATRLGKIKETSAGVKERAIGAMIFLIQTHLMSRLPLFLCREMSHRALATNTMLLSNVPGPQEPVSFAGRRLKGLHFTLNYPTPQVSVMSLNGAVGATIVVDPVTMPDSLSLPSYYLEELKALMASLGVEDDVGVAEAEKNRERLLRIMEAADPS